jgi:hypothetical protein
MLRVTTAASRNEVLTNQVVRIADFPLYVCAPFTPAPAEKIDRIRGLIIKCLSDFMTIVECE